MCVHDHSQKSSLLPPLMRHAHPVGSELCACTYSASSKSEAVAVTTSVVFSSLFFPMMILRHLLASLPLQPMWMVLLAACSPLHGLTSPHPHPSRTRRPCTSVMPSSGSTARRCCQRQRALGRTARRWAPSWRRG